MKWITLILIVLISQSNYAQVKQHPIDITNSNCQNTNSNQTTRGMINCENQAKDQWFTEMDKYYILLLDTLSEKSAIQLKDSQEAWLEYSAKEQSFSNSLYSTEMDGTMWYVVNASRLKNIVRSRALELKEYYETITFQEM